MAVGMLDERHRALPLRLHDNSNYTLGRIGDDNVVIACFPSGARGMITVAKAARKIVSTFTGLRFGVLVGIGGGVPDIRLGDVIFLTRWEIWRYDSV